MQLPHCWRLKLLYPSLSGGQSPTVVTVSGLRQRSTASYSSAQRTVATESSRVKRGVDGAITGPPSWNSGYAVWGGSKCVGVFFARWGVIFAGGGLAGTP